MRLRSTPSLTPDEVQRVETATRNLFRYVGEARLANNEPNAQHEFDRPANLAAQLKATATLLQNARNRNDLPPFGQLARSLIKGVMDKDVEPGGIDERIVERRILQVVSDETGKSASAFAEMGALQSQTVLPVQAEYEIEGNADDILRELIELPKAERLHRLLEIEKQAPARRNSEANSATS